MTKRLSDAQSHALAVLHNQRSVEVRMHAFVGVRENTFDSLFRRGLVEVIGTRKPAWMLTGEGRVTVKELIASGRLTKETKA